MAAMTIDLSIDFSRATASAICSSSSLLALTTIVFLPTSPRTRGPAALSTFLFGFVFLGGVFRFASAFLGFLARPIVLRQGIADEIVGQHQPGLGNRVIRHAHRRLFAIGRLVALQKDAVGIGLGD